MPMLKPTFLHYHTTILLSSYTFSICDVIEASEYKTNFGVSEIMSLCMYVRVCESVYVCVVLPLCDIVNVFG